MHKKLLLTLLLWLSSTYLLAQDITLEEFNQKRLKINRVGMITLGTWALGNIATSGLLLNNSRGEQQKFYEMNIYWNLVNLGLAGFGWYSSLKADPAGFSVYETWKAQAGMEKTLLFNAGLDIGYIAAGLYLRERGKNNESNRDLLKGFGKSIILQGGFLLAFDLAMYFVHQGHIGRSSALFENLGLSGQGIGLRWRF